MKHELREVIEESKIMQAASDRVRTQAQSDSKIKLCTTMLFQMGNNTC